jgi:hypothetical protein
MSKMKDYLLDYQDEHIRRHGVTPNEILDLVEIVETHVAAAARRIVREGKLDTTYPWVEDEARKIAKAMTGAGQ